jgi:hypothetical protein
MRGDSKTSVGGQLAGCRCFYIRASEGYISGRVALNTAIKMVGRGTELLSSPAKAQRGPMKFVRGNLAVAMISVPAKTAIKTRILGWAPPGGRTLFSEPVGMVAQRRNRWSRRHKAPPSDGLRETLCPCFIPALGFHPRPSAHCSPATPWAGWRSRYTSASRSGTR